MVEKRKASSETMEAAEYTETWDVKKKIEVRGGHRVALFRLELNVDLLIPATITTDEKLCEEENLHSSLTKAL